MHILMDLRDMLEREIEDIVSAGELNEQKLGCLYKMIDIIKDIGEIEMNDSGYSEMSYRDGGRSNRGNGYSGRRSYRGYSRDGEMMSRLENMMDSSQNEDERSMIRRIMNRL